MALAGVPTSPAGMPGPLRSAGNGDRVPATSWTTMLPTATHVAATAPPASPASSPMRSTTSWPASAAQEPMNLHQLVFGNPMLCQAFLGDRHPLPDGSANLGNSTVSLFPFPPPVQAEGGGHISSTYLSSGMLGSVAQVLAPARPGTPEACALDDSMRSWNSSEYVGYDGYDIVEAPPLAAPNVDGGKSPLAGLVPAAQATGPSFEAISYIESPSASSSGSGHSSPPRSRHRFSSSADGLRLGPWALPIDSDVPMTHQDITPSRWPSGGAIKLRSPSNEQREVVVRMAVVLPNEPCEDVVLSGPPRGRSPVHDALSRGTSASPEESLQGQPAPSRRTTSQSSLSPTSGRARLSPTSSRVRFSPTSGRARLSPASGRAGSRPASGRARLSPTAGRASSELQPDASAAAQPVPLRSPTTGELIALRERRAAAALSAQQLPSSPALEMLVKGTPVNAQFVPTDNADDQAPDSGVVLMDTTGPGGWALLRASAEYGRVLLVWLLFRAWVFAAVLERAQPLLAVVRRSLLQSGELAEAVEFLLARVACHQVEGLLEVVLHHWRLCIAVGRTLAPISPAPLELLGSPMGSMIDDLEPVVVIPRGPPMRLPPGSYSSTSSAPPAESGAFEFLLLMIDTHRLDRMLQVVTVAWHRHAIKTRHSMAQEALRQSEESRKSAVIAGLMGEKAHDTRTVLCSWHRVVQESVLKRAEAHGDRQVMRELHWRKVGEVLAQWQQEVDALILSMCFMTWYARTQVSDSTRIAIETTMQTVQREHDLEIEIIRKQHSLDMNQSFEVIDSSQANVLVHSCWMRWVQLVRDRKPQVRACIRSIAERRAIDIGQHVLEICWLRWADFMVRKKQEVQVRKRQGVLVGCFEEIQKGADNTSLMRLCMQSWWREAILRCELIVEVASVRARQISATGIAIARLSMDIDDNLLLAVWNLWVRVFEENREETRQLYFERAEAQMARDRRIWSRDVLVRWAQQTHMVCLESLLTSVWQHWQQAAALAQAQRRLEFAQRELTTQHADSLLRLGARCFNLHDIQCQQHEEAENFNTLGTCFSGWAVLSNQAVRGSLNNAGKRRAMFADKIACCWDTSEQRFLKGSCMHNWQLTMAKRKVAVGSALNHMQSARLQGWRSNMERMASSKLEGYQDFLCTVLLRWRLEVAAALTAELHRIQGRQMERRELHLSGVTTWMVADQSRAFMKVVMNHWGDYVAEENERKLREEFASKLERTHDICHIFGDYSQRSADSSVLQIYILQWSRCAAEQSALKRQSALADQRCRHRNAICNLFNAWSVCEAQSAKETVFIGWRQCTNNSIQAHLCKEVQILVARVRKHDYGMVAECLHAWCKIQTLQRVEQAENLRQDSLTWRALSRRQMDNSCQYYRAEFENYLVSFVWSMWVLVTCNSQMEKRVEQAEEDVKRLTTVGQRRSAAAANVFLKGSVGFWFHTWHDSALHCISQREECQMSKIAARSARRERTTKLNQLTCRFLAELDAVAVEPFFRALVGIVAAGRAARLHQLKVTSGMAVAGNLAKMDTVSLVSIVLQEWQRLILTSRHEKQLDGLERARSRALQSMVSTTGQHGCVAMTELLFHTWTRFTQASCHERIRAEASRQHSLLQDSLHLALNNAFNGSNLDTCKVVLSHWHRYIKTRAHNTLKTSVLGRLACGVSNDLSSIFTAWRLLIYGKHQTKLLKDSRRRHTPLVGQLVARTCINTAQTLMLEVVTAWKTYAIRTAVANGWRRLRCHISTSFSMLIALQDSRGPCVEVVETFHAWARTARKLSGSTRAANARVTLYRLIGSSVAEQTVASIRTVFHGWARMRLHRKICQANQTSAVLTHWASTQVLARLTLQGWVSVAAQTRRLKAELRRVGGQHLHGAQKVVWELATHRLSEFMHAVLMAWQEAMLDAGRGARYATPTQFALMQRRAAMAPAGVAAFQLLSAAKAVSMTIVWNVWWTAVALSKMEVIVETQNVALTNVQERQELLMGFTVLVWTQEKSLAFARIAMIAWCRIAISAAREADLATLASDRAMLEGAAYYERNRRFTDVGHLLNRVFTESDLSWYTICFMEWKRIPRELDGKRRAEELTTREAEARERISLLVQTALNSSPHSQANARGCILHARMALVSWYCQTLKTSRVSVEDHHKMRVSHTAASIAALFCSTHTGNAETQCRLAYFAWKSVTAQGLSGEGGKTERLADDLQMMVELLEQSSATIEELRIRLLLVRIFGIVRRQIFHAWQRVVEAKYARQIANATHAASHSIQQEAAELARAAALDNQSSAGNALEAASLNVLALGEGVGPSSPLAAPLVDRSGQSASKSREALVRQLQQAREALAQPRH